VDNFRRLVGLAVVLMLGTLLPIGSSGAGSSAGTNQITLRGKGSSYVDVVIDETITPRTQGVTVSTTGTYAGYLITEHVGDIVSLVGGSYVVPSFERKTKEAAGVGLGPLTLVEQELEPGTYRFVLITDGVATVKIPTAGLSRSMTLRTSHAARALSALEHMGNGPGDFEERWPLRRTKATVTVLNLLQIVDSHQASFVQQCLKDGSENFDPCNQAEDWGATWAITSPGSVGPGWVFDFFGYYPGYEVGEKTGVQRVAQAVAGSENFAFFLNVPLTAPAHDNMEGPAPKETFSFDYQFSNVQGQPVCGAYAGVMVRSCWGVPARPTDHRATVKIVDAAGGPTAAKVVSGGRTIEICGETAEPVKVTPGDAVYVEVYAHPTPDCPTGHGTTGRVEVTLGT
jgi:hypothetical protein